MKTLAERLKFSREKANLSQQEVADRAGMSQPTYYKIESGKTRRTTYLNELATILKVNPTWLATGDGQMTAVAPYGTFDWEQDTPPSTSTIHLIETLKDMEKKGELTPQVVGLLNTALSTVKSIQGLSVSHLLETEDER